MSTLNKANLDSIRFAFKDESRPAISGLNVRNEFTETTDGHRAMRVPLESNGDIGILKADPVKAANKLTGKNDRVSFEGSSLECHDGTRMAAVTDTESTYPNLDQVWPEVSTEWLRVGIDPGYLAEIAAFFKRHSGYDNTVEMYFHPTESATRPMLLVCGDMQALLMPVRIPEKSKHAANKP